MPLKNFGKGKRKISRNPKISSRAQPSADSRSQSRILQPPPEDAPPRARVRLTRNAAMGDVEDIINETVRQQNVRDAREARRRGGRAAAFPEPTGHVSDLSMPEWCVRYVPFFQRGLYPSQMLMNDWREKYAWNMISIFRGAGKSHFLAACKARRLCDDPNRICSIIRESQSRAGQTMQYIRNIIGGQAAIQDYGFLFETGTRSPMQYLKGMDTSHAVKLKRDSGGIDPSLVCSGWKESSSQGFHTTDQYIDDPWSHAMQSSEKLHEKFMGFMGEFLFTLENCEEFDFSFTHKGPEDPYSKLENEYGMWAVLEQPLVKTFPPDDSYEIYTDDVGQHHIRVLDQAKFDTAELYYDCFGKYRFTEPPDEYDSRGRLKKKRVKCVLLDYDANPLNFMCEMQCTPMIAQGNVFSWDDVQLYELQDTPNSPNRWLREAIGNEVMGGTKPREAVDVLMLDLATGTSADADESALAALRGYMGRVFLMYMWCGQWTYDQREEIIGEAHDFFPDATFVVEEDFGQAKHVKKHGEKFGFKWKKFRSRGRGHKYNFYGNGEKAKKCAKIHEGMEVILSHGEFWADQNCPHLKKFQQQLVGFPNPPRGLFDVLDSVAMGSIWLDKRIKPQAPSPQAGGQAEFTSFPPRNPAKSTATRGLPSREGPSLMPSRGAMIRSGSRRRGGRKRFF